MQTESLTGILGELWRRVLMHRRGQFVLILLLTLLGAAAEVLTLGALFPFLAFLADPGAVERSPAAQAVLSAAGISSLGGNLIVLTLVFCGAALIAGALRIAITSATMRFIFGLTRDLSVTLFDHILSTPYSYHASRNSSTAIASLRHVEGVTSGVLMPLLQVASATIIGIFIVVALVAIDPLVAFLSFAGFGAIYVAVSVVVRRRLKANARIVVETQKEAVRTVQEGLGGIRDIIIDGTRPAFIARFAEVETALWRAQQANALAAAVPRFAIEAAGMALIAGVAAIVASENADIARVLPVIGVFALGAQRLLPLLQLAYGNWALAVSNLSAVRVVLDLLDAPLERDEPTAPAEPLPFQREIAFRDVSFRYSSDRPGVLDGTSFSIARGSKVMIVGQTGAGKSTIVDLLMGLLEPTGGTIEIDGRRLDGRTRFGWRQQIAHVPQSIFLADASIAANIAFGVPSAQIDLARVREAARRACIEGFVATLPDGYDTVVGERGVNLSGGQRQRIGLARALYKRASVLILDEATNALDPETEIAVFESICALAGITVVIVAHRLSPQQFCDQILEVVPGRAISRASDGALVPSERRSLRGADSVTERADDRSGPSERSAFGLAPPP